MGTTDKMFKGGLPTLKLVGTISASLPGAAGTLDTTGTVTAWPTGAGGHSFVLVIDSEAILCSARSGNQFTVEQRGYDDTTAASHANNADVKHELDAASILAYEQHIVKTAGAHTAAAITNVAAGNIAATNVQAAINELDTEKADATTTAASLATKVAKATVPVTLCIPVGDETTAITTGTAKVTFRMPFAMTVASVRASLTTASSSGLPTFDINEAGTTILSTKLSIDASELTSTTAATPAVISDTALADDAEITIDVDVSGTGAKGAKVYITGTTVQA